MFFFLFLLSFSNLFFNLLLLFPTALQKISQQPSLQIYTDEEESAKTATNPAPLVPTPSSTWTNLAGQKEVAKENLQLATAWSGQKIEQKTGFGAYAAPSTVGKLGFQIFEDDGKQ